MCSLGTVVPRGNLLLPSGSAIWRTQQEKFCEDGVCPEVTTALYLTPDDLSRPEWIRKVVKDAVGFEVPELRPDPPRSEEQ